MIDNIMKGIIFVFALIGAYFILREILMWRVRRKKAKKEAEDLEAQSKIEDNISRIGRIIEHKIRSVIPESQGRIESIDMGDSFRIYICKLEAVTDEKFGGLEVKTLGYDINIAVCSEVEPKIYVFLSGGKELNFTEADSDKIIDEVRHYITEHWKAS